MTEAEQSQDLLSSKNKKTLANLERGNCLLLEIQQNSRESEVEGLS